MKDSKLILLQAQQILSAKNDTAFSSGKGQILSFLLNEGRLTEVNAYDMQSGLLGGIYTAKVLNTVPNINAAFIEAENRQRCFLSMEHLKQVFMLNRPFDGRILPGDEILVQVERDAVKTKDPVAVTQISLPGRYAVVIPVLHTTGSPCVRLSFSGKLPASQKERLRKELETGTEYASICSKTACGFYSLEIIIRTNAGELADPTPLAAEIDHLSKRVKTLLETADKRSCCSCLYRPSPAWLLAIRDTAHEQFEKIVTDDPQLYDEIQTYLAEEYPEELHKLTLYDDESLPLQSLYGLQSRMREALDTRVWLKSGGYLVIEPTEALTVIDVNTGKYTGRKAVQDTFALINTEAAAEIARQLRLRNLSGIIIVDFISMERESDQKELLRFLSEELKKDPVRTVLIDMTSLGLVEITRKKIRKTLKEQLDS